MSQNFRLLHVSNLSIRNFRIFSLMYPGSLNAARQAATEPYAAPGPLQRDARTHGGMQGLSAGGVLESEGGQPREGMAQSNTLLGLLGLRVLFRLNNDGLR